MMVRARIGGIAFGTAWLCAFAAGVSWDSPAAGLLSQPVSADSPRIRGFSAAGSTAETARETAFKAMPTPREAEADFDVMTAEPHHAGSPYQIKLAGYVGDQFRKFGLETADHEYSILIPWPGERTVDIVAPDQLKLHVEEEVLPNDPYSSKPGILPAYNAYSPSGDVTGDVVYVNFGVPADYEQLAKLGVDVRGKIVLARYGGSWRGIKPKVAAEHGAIGCIIYSDPHEDGYFQGDVFPEGPYRGWGMIQRGSVMDMPTYPGDPSTPDRPSKPGVERLSMAQIKTFSPIPVQPMSYRDGVEILKRLKGPVAPEAWRGALPVTYHVGAGPAKVHMKLQMDYGQRRLIDVVGRITGSELPDEWIIVGSHRDAWVFGASDSVSGHVSMMSVARAFGDMMRKGWRPRRSILFVSWDGEEPGLLGSTEFVEDLATELKANAAVYINRDAGADGPIFGAGAVHSLTPFLHELAQSVAGAESGKTLYDGWLARARQVTKLEAGQPPIQTPPVSALGSGSDYTAFLDHVGISAIDMGLNGEGGGGTYHSAYDDPIWFRKFIDPEFKYSVLASQVTGVALLRLADADLLPLDYESYGRQIAIYVDEIEKEAAAKAADGTRRIDFARLRSAADAFAKAGAAFNAEAARALDGPRDKSTLAALDRRMMQAERDLIEPAGLPDRPWFRHTIYAPGLYTGYGVKTIPGVREAVDAGNFTRGAEQADIVIRALERATKTLSNK